MVVQFHNTPKFGVSKQVSFLLCQIVVFNSVVLAVKRQ